MIRLIAAAVLICSAPAAYADDAAATACAASLPPQARTVFDAVMADPKPAVPLRRVLAKTLADLVYSGRLPLGAARSAAEGASECLRIARDCTASIC
ncbi:MAG: hypothetical protein ABSA58_18260 [Acetobacteraceae bacterium]|jgi:hypothetical protein